MGEISLRALAEIDELGGSLRDRSDELVDLEFRYPRCTYHLLLFGHLQLTDNGLRISDKGRTALNDYRSSYS